MTKKERGFFFIKEPSCLLINGKNTIERNKYKEMNIMPLVGLYGEYWSANQEWLIERD